MYLYGASGHAKVIIDILRANGIEVKALYDDNEALQELAGRPVLHTSDIQGPLIISIGNNGIRRRIAERLKVDFASAVHPSAIVSPSARIGEGSVVMQGAIIQAEAHIGRHCIVNTGASVDHECRIGDYAHISPHATLCGNVQVGEGTWIGAGAIVIPGIRIGRDCVVGAGAVVIRDLPDGVKAVGNPCKDITG